MDLGAFPGAGWTVGPGVGGRGLSKPRMDRGAQGRWVAWPGAHIPGLRRGRVRAAWGWGWLWHLLCELSPVGSEVRTQRPHSCARPVDILTGQTSLTTRCPALSPRLPISHFPQGHGPSFSGLT